MLSLTDIWQPSVAFDTVHQPAWLLERTTAGIVLEGACVARGSSAGSSTRSLQAAREQGISACHSCHSIGKRECELKNNVWQHKWEHEHLFVMWPGKALSCAKDKFLIHITLMFIQWTGRTQGIFGTTGKLLWEMNNINYFSENKLASHEIACNLHKHLKEIENRL